MRTKLKKIRLSDKHAIALSGPASGRRYIYDEVVPGLLLQITSHGAKSWQVYKNFRGRPVRLTLGRFPIVGTDEARAEAIRVLADLAKGVTPEERKRLIQMEQAPDVRVLGVRLVPPHPGETSGDFVHCLAFVDVEIGGRLLFRSVQVLQAAREPFVELPVLPLERQRGDTQYAQPVRFLDAALWARFEAAVLDAYRKESAQK